ncbi:hypothetical protein Hanom_Chr10g00905391 [Helianthus anomalus]
MIMTSGGECVKILQLSDERRIERRIEPSNQVLLKIPATPVSLFRFIIVNMWQLYVKCLLVSSLSIVYEETSSAQYILQQYLAASGGQKFQNSIHTAYAMGKVKMLAFDIETATKVIKKRNSSKTAESGSFVLWQMNPNIWYVELAHGASKVHAGCNGRLVWRHMPWLGAHAAEGPIRPLRRAL